MRKVNVRGIKYNVCISGSGPPLLMLHGFTGSVQTWDAVLARFAQQFTTVRVDLLGHGHSDKPRDHHRYALPECARDLGNIMEHLGYADFHLMGYSLGGRTALHTALACPGRILSLVLESTSPGIVDVKERKARVQSDATLADFIEREGVLAFVDYWEKIPLFATEKRLPEATRNAIRLERLANEPHGLANSLRGAGAGTQEYLLDQAQHLNVRTLVVAGALDTKYCDLAYELGGTLPLSKVTIVPDAGHAVHRERPDAFSDVVLDFLQCADRTATTPEVQTKQLILWGTRHMAIQWKEARDYEDILYHTAEGIAKITINRPEVHNAFRPNTVTELMDAFAAAREDPDVGVIILTGAGTKAFCSGGDQKVRGHGGYVGEDTVPRLNVLDLQRQIRTLPKPVIAMVAGYAIGGGHVLHIVCDLTIAADNAVFGQTGPRVGSFDAGYGATLLARMVGHKKAREIWYLCRQYNAEEALQMGLINTIVPVDQLEAETVQWAREMLQMSPTALRFLKASFNADTDGLAGIQQLAGDATLLFYQSEEAKEGQNAFLEKRKPDFSKYPRFP